MSKQAKHITVYEYQTISIGNEDNESDKSKFATAHFDLLLKHSDQFTHVYQVLHNKVRFKSFVGVLQLGEYTFEILPKMDIDKQSKQIIEPNHWRNVLIDMLRYTQTLQLTASDFGNLNHKNNSILELYFEYFLKEVDYLFRRGFVKKYRPKEDNLFALKGKLKFGKHLSKNLVHQERFYVEHTTYDVEHTIHQILYKTIKLIKQFNLTGNVRSLTYNLLLNLPEFKDVKVLAATFEKLQLNRKSEHYKTALSIAKMILLHYHPDTQSGKEEVLALVFDMNKLWEKFVLKSIATHCSEVQVSGQQNRAFIEGENERSNGFSVSAKNMIPDVFIRTKDKKNYVLDTKWKNVQKSGDISDADYRQLFTYLHYFDCEKVAFLYPSNVYDNIARIDYTNYQFRRKEPVGNLRLDGLFLKIESNSGVEFSVKKWSTAIGQKVENWIKDN